MSVSKVVLSFANISLLLVFCIHLAHSVEYKNTPFYIAGVTAVTAEQVLDLVEKTPTLMIIDARIKADRQQGYIEGSISLPDIKTNCTSLAKLIPKKNTSVLFYCNGVKCGRSANSCKSAVKCGYSNVYWFRGGFEEWQAKNYLFVK